MNRHRNRALAAAGIAAVSTLVAMALIVAPALATPPSGAITTPLAPVVHVGPWDIHFVQVTIQPGGTVGWHSHPGPSLVFVKSGTATVYHGDDPTCTPQVIPTGSRFSEPAGDVHIVRNEGSVPLVNFVIQFVPTGAMRRIDEPDPGNCHF